MSKWIIRMGVAAAMLLVALAATALLVARADGPLWVFHGGPFRSGERVALGEIDWESLDALHELEMEIVADESSRTLWFSVREGTPYVGCDVDCVGGRLERWPQQIDVDDRVVIRIDGKRANARLVHVAHGTPEYAAARLRREQKYAGTGGGRAAAETAAHGAVVEWGEAITGRDVRPEPGDRLYRIEPR